MAISPSLVTTRRTYRSEKLLQSALYLSVSEEARMSKLFLGRGVGFPISLSGEGNLNSADYEESVRQSILIILGTAKGERVMRPGFGCGIYDLVFEVNTPSTAGRVSQSVQDALLVFEPRIDVINVSVNSGIVARNPQTN